MTTLFKLTRIHAARLVALVVVMAVYGFARLPGISQPERAALASRFSFTQLQLPELKTKQPRFVRPVHPDMQHIAGWISSVGAAVALNDLDQDGLSNDLCYVDTRTDQIIVAPVPGQAGRYEPFEMDPSPLPFDTSTMAPMGCLPGDFNEDGATDLLTYYWGRTPILFFQRKPDRHTTSPLHRGSYEARELVGSRERWYTNCATQADLDGDGHLDLIIGNYFQDGARILDANAGPELRGTEAMQDSMSRAYNGGRNRLLLWTAGNLGTNPGVRFTEAPGALSGEVARAWTLAVGAADLDGDMLPEIYFANDFGPDRLLHNRSTPGNLKFSLLEGRRGLTTPNSKVLGRDSFKGMGVDFADLNGDGLLDIFVSNIADEYALEESHFVWVSTGEPELMKQGIAPYVDRSEPLGLSRSGWGWDARLADFDNDGIVEALQATGFMKGGVDRWPELHELAMANDQLLSWLKVWPRFQPGDDLSGRHNNPFFIRAQDGRYYNLARDIGIDQSKVGRGIAIADVNGDGRLDFAMANQWTPSSLYINTSSHAAAFLGLRLLLPAGQASAEPLVGSGHGYPGLPARLAVGATVRVRLPNGQILVSHADGGSGHSGKRSPEIHLGLGSVPLDADLQVEVRWCTSEGELRKEGLTLKPGRHTVMLSR